MESEKISIETNAVGMMSHGKWLLEICGNTFRVSPDGAVLKVSLVNIQLLRFRKGISRVWVFFLVNLIRRSRVRGVKTVCQKKIIIMDHRV